MRLLQDETTGSSAEIKRHRQRIFAERSMCSDVAQIQQDFSGRPFNAAILSRAAAIRRSPAIRAASGHALAFLVHLLQGFTQVQLINIHAQCCDRRQATSPKCLSALFANSTRLIRVDAVNRNITVRPFRR